MARLSPAREAFRCPATVLVGLGAIAVSVSWWAGRDITGLVVGDSLRQPWRLATSVFPHLDPIHLVFNLYWWWAFGVRIERAWGPWALLGISLLLAMTSGAAEFALMDGGVGLSGVGYGLFALLLVVQKRVPALAGSVDRRTVEVFVAWFVICVVATATGYWKVGNIAHGAGAAFGTLLGACIAAPCARRPIRLAGLGAAVAVLGLAATVGRPTVNLSNAPTRSDFEGYRALQAGRNDEAVRLLEQAAAERPRRAGVLANLGVAYQRVGRHHEALGVYTRAVGLDPEMRIKLTPSIVAILDNEAHDAAVAGDDRLAISLAEEALRWVPDDRYAIDLLRAVRANGEGASKP